MIRIAVCEDEQVLLDELSGQVSKILEQHSIAYNIESFRNGSALLAREAYDILLLDIEMEPMDGLELAGKLRMRGDDSRLVFITAHQQYAVDAYEVHPFHYLVKPVDSEKLETVLLQLCDSLHRERGRAVIVRQGTAVRRVPLEQILYLEVLDRKIYLHTVEETVPFYGKLEDLEPALTRPELVPDSFFRCHRSYIVNLRHVQLYDKNEIRLDNEDCIPLSKRRYKSFGLAFMHYLKERGDVF
nr:LytTR family DNA-binding domain-containing protein [uncultured Schaedlerella sp.]